MMLTGKMLNPYMLTHYILFDCLIFTTLIFTLTFIDLYMANLVYPSLIDFYFLLAILYMATEWNRLTRLSQDICAQTLEERQSQLPGLYMV